eukprot:3721263-Pleurochrysis_carterae.AAC.2
MMLGVERLRRKHFQICVLSVQTIEAAKHRSSRPSKRCSYSALAASFETKLKPCVPFSGSGRTAKQTREPPLLRLSNWSPYSEASDLQLWVHTGMKGQIRRETNLLRQLNITRMSARCINQTLFMAHAHARAHKRSRSA